MVPAASKSIVCPTCQLRSYHPKDIAERYCGACHLFHDVMRAELDPKGEAEPVYRVADTHSRLSDVARDMLGQLQKYNAELLANHELCVMVCRPDTQKLGTAIHLVTLSEIEDEAGARKRMAEHLAANLLLMFNEHPAIVETVGLALAKAVAEHLGVIPGSRPSGPADA